MRLILALSGLVFSSALLADVPQYTVEPVKLHNVVVFGDSLSDTGNLHHYCVNHNPPIIPAMPSEPYYQGRFSDGPVWIEYFMDEYFKGNQTNHLSNYAFGGAGVSNDDWPISTYSKQVDTYLAAHGEKADPNTLYVNWIGSNNYLGDPDNALNSVDDVIFGIKTQVQRLIAHGAKYLVLIDVPDLSITPFAREDQGLGDLMKQCSDKHNKSLEAMYQDLKMTYPDVHFVFIDVNKTFRDIFKFPDAYGFKNVTDKCFKESYEQSVSEPELNSFASQILGSTLRKNYACSGYLFADELHPTTQAHEIMAIEAQKILALEGIEIEG